MKKLIFVFLFCSSIIYSQTPDSYTYWQRTNQALSPKKIFETTGGLYFIYDNHYLYTSNSLFYSWDRVPYTYFQSPVNSIISTGSNVYLAGTAGDGIYRSTSLTNWTKISSGLPDSLGVINLVKHTGGAIFAGTNKGVYVSSDMGLSWSARNNSLPVDYKVSNLNIDNGGKIYVTENQSSPGQGRGLYGSIDAGLTWQKVNEVPNYEVFSPIYINQVGNVFTSGISYAGGIPTYGLYKSSTGADSFKFVSAANPTSLINTQFNSYIATFNYNIPSFGSKVSVSDDGGVTWTHRLESSYSRYENLYSISNGSFILTGGGPGLLKSTNLGNNWKTELYGIPLGWKTSKIAFNQQKLFAIANYELFSSNTSGDSWSHHNLAEAQASTSGVQDIGFFGNSIYIMRHSQLYKSTNSGINFSQLSTIAGMANFKINNAGNIFIYGNEIYRTTNEGANWESLFNGYPPGSRINSMEFNTEGTIFIGTHNAGIYKSTNNGNSWVSANNGMTGANILSIMAFGSTVYAGTSGFGLFRSIDLGNSWTKINNGIAADNLNYLSIVKNQSMLFSSDEIIVATGKYEANSNYRGIMICSNMQNPTWRTLNSRETTNDTSAYSLAWRDYGRLYYGGDSGVYWQGWGDDIRNISSEVPDKFSLSQNFPNPFNPSTKFTYDINVKTFVELIVFDVSGREVAKLFSGIQSPGKYEATFDASSFSLTSGVYFYRLKTDAFTETKKMVLVK